MAVVTLLHPLGPNTLANGAESCLSPGSVWAVERDYILLAVCTSLPTLMEPR